MSFPRLYLASSVTTARTAGMLEPYTDLHIKKMGYLEGHGSFAPEMAELDSPTTLADSWNNGPAEV